MDQENDQQADPSSPTQTSDSHLQGANETSTDQENEQVDRSGWPKWVSDAYDALMADNRPSDDRWATTLTAWITFEQNHEFRNPNGSSATLKATGRPHAISWWFRNRKPVSREPPDDIFGDVNEFAAQWWVWWSMINPPWRERDSTTGRVIINETDNGDWSNLTRPGQCGILTVLFCLFWWHQRLPGPCQEWSNALRDVAWVVNELVHDTKYCSISSLRI
ncbi:hypothetical protein EV360DRAFT_58423 [Lentinula raphanica]|nr:hypothetical protein EV360DRAFT_58423 [Lentinula raphanica]